MPRFLDEPFVLQKSQITHAFAIVRDLAYWRTSPLPQYERAVCARVVYRLSRLLTELE
jgi:hypothetical protein